MIDATAAPPPDPGQELLDLVELLDATERRIEELTLGEVDSVMARDGRAFLLRRAQEQVRLSESAKQASILDALPARIALLDPQGTIISENEAWREYARGMRPMQETGLSYIAMCSAREGTDAGYAKQIAAGMRSVLDGESPSFALEYLDELFGRRVWCLTTVTPLAGSPPSGAVVMHVDTTAKREAEERLRETDARFRQLADNIDTVFFLRDASGGEILYVSPAYEKIWGRSCESLYADPRSWGDSFHPEDREATRAAHLAAGIGGHFRLEFRVVRPDGSVRWISSRGFPVRDEGGVVVRVAGIAEDITERKQALERLRESETRYRTLTDASFDAITVTQDGILLEVNSGFERMFGYTAAEVIGHHVTELSSPEAVAGVEQHLLGGANGTYQTVALRKNGERIFLEVTARPHTVDGKDARLAALRDVTERRQLEEQFRQAQKMEAVGRLAGGVAHDFNNQLAVIIAYAAFVHEGLLEGDPQRADVEEIQKAAVGAAALTRQLLTFSRQQVVAPRIIALDMMVGSSVAMLGRLLGEDVELVVRHTGGSATALIDPGQFEQIVMNLVVNARDAMPTGGKLSIATAVVDLDDEYIRSHWPATRGRFAMLEVSDTGIGMDGATRDRVFEPFFTTKGTGTGLGLATVYGIVKQSGGSLWLESEPGKGAAFRIYIPFVEGVVTLPDQQPAVAQPLSGTETILLAEDAAPVRGAVRRMLQSLGYRVLVAPSAAVALRFAESQEKIHLLVTDVVMPEMSGRVLAERFNELRPGVQVLYMSGYTDDAIVRHGVLSASVNFIEKPFTPEKLARTVRDLLQHE
ncbi:MAG TPA: PAS domain S-box protein [Gemmatimonadaceae bacterium]|nr:PAS domain S-box protein [Gemmatimonadaceae bacterium]